MSGNEIDYRAFAQSDTEEAYRMFRASVFDYVESIGLIELGEGDDVEAAWGRQQGMFDHLTVTATRDWIAESEDGIVGWARSIERDGHVQLTHFFVHPSAQGKGVGRGLLERAFPIGWGESRSVVATQNPLALSLYLRHGVQFRGSTLDLFGPPRGDGETGGIELKPIDDIEQVVAIDQGILGYRRAVDLEYLAGARGVNLCVRDGEVVGYAFGHDGNYTGPIGLHDGADMPYVLAHIDRMAKELQVETLHFSIPANSHHGVRWAIESGFRIDPFYEMLLASEPIQLDRYLITQPTFFW